MKPKNGKVLSVLKLRLDDVISLDVFVIMLQNRLCKFKISFVSNFSQVPKIGKHESNIEGSLLH